MEIQLEGEKVKVTKVMKEELIYVFLLLFSINDSIKSLWHPWPVFRI